MHDALIDTLPLPQRLALSYAPKKVRSGTLALLALDERLSGILRQKGETIIAQMKLAWWRDRFAETPTQWPEGEPLLGLLREFPGDLTRLGKVVDGWELLLSENLDAESIDTFAHGRAQGWLSLAHSQAAQIDEMSVLFPARQFALADLSMHMDKGDERTAVEALLTKERAFKLGKPPSAIRTLMVMRALALRAVDQSNDSLLTGPSAMALAMRVGITGR
ncbi:hypothetical protein [Aurantiacibacter sediminis]|uniref:Phytoene synthase n=1 Tax=Aurantiacibacter sediminis TaxID=2793064 RepID=A0ABS0N3Y4_9SPHN|nr:hypothetical protein [Aurantiacibacter sediminis]MBH5322680.1 hypothetical protein [Aurantiacibacter sediminis]